MLKLSLFQKLYFFLFAFVFSLNQNVSAQAEKENLPTSGFDTTQFNPVFIQSKDGMFRLNMGIYTQFRYNMTWLDNTPNDTDHFYRGYNLARTRIFFEGDLTDRFYYHFRTNINPSGNVELMVAYLQWKANDKMKFRFGKQFMALGREDWILPQELASIDFSAHDFTFAIWTSFGVQFNHTPSNKFRYWLSVGNGSYGSRRAFPDRNDSDVMLTGRAEWNVFGTDWDIWDDMLGRKGRPFGMLLGIGAANNHRYDKDALLTDPQNGTQLNLDYTLSGDGFQLFIHGSITDLTYKDTVSPDVTTGGVYSTLGYWLNQNFFTYLRYDFVALGNITYATEVYSSPGIGISYYPFTWSNRVRFTAEYNHLSSTINNTIVEPDGQLGVIATDYGSQQSLRFQVQFGF